MNDRDDGPPNDGQSAELRQIEALNRAHPGEGKRRVAPGEPGEQDAAARAPNETNRQRDVRLLDAGHALAEASSVAEVFQAVSSLRSPEFPLDGTALFAVTERSLNLIGRFGYRTGGGRTVRMPVTTDHPAAEVLRTGRPVYLTSAEEYRDRFPTTWTFAVRKGSRSWALMPLVSGGRMTGVWLVAFLDPVEFGAGMRNTLVALARQVAQALERGHNRRGRARPVPGAAAQHGDGRLGAQRHDRGLPLRADRRRSGGGRRLVRRHRPAVRPDGPGHR